MGKAVTAVARAIARRAATPLADASPSAAMAAAAVRAIARNCDVVVENFVPGKADELGVGWEDLNKVNNRLIYASVSG